MHWLTSTSSNSSSSTQGSNNQALVNQSSECPIEDSGHGDSQALGLAHLILGPAHLSPNRGL